MQKSSQVDQQMKVSQSIHQQSNFAGFDVACGGGVVGFFRGNSPENRSVSN